MFKSQGCAIKCTDLEETLRPHLMGHSIKKKILCSLKLLFDLTGLWLIILALILTSKYKAFNQGASYANLQHKHVRTKTKTHLER